MTDLVPVCVVALWVRGAPRHPNATPSVHDSQEKVLKLYLNFLSYFGAEPPEGLILDLCAGL